MFDGDQIPFDEQKAILHAKAHCVGVQGRTVCPCCGYFVISGQLPLMIDKEDLTFLGSGYPLYFAFIKNCIFLCCLHVMVVGQYALVSNFYGKDCLDKSYLTTYLLTHNRDICISDEITILSLANNRRNNELNHVKEFMTLISAIIMMIFLLYFRKKQRKLDVFCDLQELTPADYTLFVYQISDETKLKIYFEQDLFGNSEKIRVMKINLTYDLTKIQEMEKQREIIIEEKKKAYLKKETFDENRLNFVELNLHSTMHEQNFEFTGAAFVSLKYDQQKDLILKKAQKDYLSLFLNSIFGLLFVEGKLLDYYGSTIKIMEAPEPTDVNWNDLHLWAKSSVIRRILGSIIAVVCNIILSIMVYLVTIKQQEMLENMESQNQEENMLSKHYIKVHIYSLGYSLVTVLINSLILDKITRILVGFQAFPTFSQINIAIASKLSFMMFLNSAAVQCLVSIQNGNLYQPGGFVYNMTYFFLSNSIVPPILKVIDLKYIQKRIKQFYYSNFGVLTQQEANLLYEYPEHAIEEGYADVLKTMNVTFLIGPLLPIGYIFTIIGLIFYYWAEKYTLLRRKTVYHTPAFGLSSSMTDSLQLIPIIYLFANGCFKYYVSDQISYIHFIGCTIALIYHFLPNDKLVDSIWDFQERNEYAKYDELNFQSDYDRENPITRKNALKHWISREGRNQRKHIDHVEDYSTLQKKQKEIEQQLELFK